MTKEIQDKIEDRINQGMYSNEKSFSVSDFFKQGAVFGYSLAEAEIEKLQTYNNGLHDTLQQWINTDTKNHLEIERLKGLVKNLYFNYEGATIYNNGRKLGAI